MDKILKVLIVAAFLNAISWIILTPIWQYPDEQAHFSQVQDIAESNHLPASPDQFNTSEEIAISEKILKTERDQIGNNSYTYHPEFNIPYSNTTMGPQEKEILDLEKSSRITLVKNEATVNPPLYYLLGSIFYYAFYSGSLFTRVFAVRLFSALLFLAFIFTAYKISQIIFTKNKPLQIAYLTMLSFLPMLVYSSTGILPDPLTNLLFSLLILFSLKIINSGFKTKYTFSALAVIFLGFFTRQNFYIAFFLILTPATIAAFKNPKVLKPIAAAIVFFTGFLYFAHNFGTSLPIISNFRISDTTAFALSVFSPKLFIQHAIGFIKHFVAETWPWYWGVYRWLSLTLPPITYQIINRLVLVSAIGLLIWGFKKIKNRKFEDSDLNFALMFLFCAIYFLAFLVWDFLYVTKNNYSFGLQGRYFFPIETSAMALLLLGFGEVFKIIKSFNKVLILAICTLMIAFNDYTLYFVSSFYYDTASLENFVNQASQYKPLFIKGNVILVILASAVILQIILLAEIARALIFSNESAGGNRQKKAR